MLFRSPNACPTELPALGGSSLAWSSTRLVLPKPSTISGPWLPAEFRSLSLAPGSRGRCEPRTLNLGPNSPPLPFFLPSFPRKEATWTSSPRAPCQPLNSWVSILWGRDYSSTTPLLPLPSPCSHTRNPEVSRLPYDTPRLKDPVSH